MTTVLKTIEQLDNVAKIPALRSVVHTSLSRTIGAIRQSIRDNEPDGEAMKNARSFYNLYHYALTELLKLTTNKWDMPLDVYQMVAFMQKENPMPDEVATAIATASGVPVEQIKELNAVQVEKDREALERDAPKIIEVFTKLTPTKTKGVQTVSIDVEQQLTEKVISSLVKAKGQTMNRVIRTRKLEDLANLATYDKAIEQLQAQ